MNNCSAISSREQVTVYSRYTHVKTERENSCCLAENEQLFSYIKSRTSYCIFMLHSRQDWARKKLLLAGNGKLFSYMNNIHVTARISSRKGTIVQLYQVTVYSCYTHVKTERENSCCYGNSAISSRKQVTVYSCYTHAKTERENSCCLAEKEQLFSYIKSRTSYCIFMLHSRQDWARKKLLLSGKWTIVQLYQVENKLLYFHATLTSRLSEEIVVV